METMTAGVAYYAEFLFPGIFLAENSQVRIEEPNEFKVPVGAIGYRTFRRTCASVDGEEVLGKPRDYSGWTYIGRAWTVEEVEACKPDQKILISNMRGNGYKAVCETHRGMWLPLNEGDRVVEVKKVPR